MDVQSKAGAIEPSNALGAALQKAMAFPISMISGLLVAPEKAHEWAQQEAAFGTLAIDELGMSAGMKLHLMQHVRSVLSLWRQARSDFDSAIQPKMASIGAVHKAQVEVEEAERARDEALGSIERKLEANVDYINKRQRKDTAYGYWKEKEESYSGRAAVMFGYSIYYKVLIACIGIAEWFINYDTLLEFSGVPAIAAGTTILLGVLLAFAAHGHGELLRQWSYRFSESREPRQRARDWRYFGMSTVALLVVLSAAGASRYSAALQILATQMHHSLLSNVGVMDVNPLRDVLISLLANIAAWIVGVFLSYMSHDDDPDYASATRQWNRAHAAWAAGRGRYQEEQRHIEAKFAKTITDKRNAAKTRAASVETELSMIKQIQAHETAINQEVEAVTRSNIATYREALTRVVLSSNGKTQMVAKPSNSPLSPFEFNAMDLPASKAMQQLLAA